MEGGFIRDGQGPTRFRYVGLKGMIDWAFGIVRRSFRLGSWRLTVRFRAFVSASK